MKKENKLKIFIIFLIFISMTFISMTTVWGTIDTTGIEIGEAYKKDAEGIGNIILSIVQVAGTVIAVVTLMMIGIKYMLGSVEEKAEYKKALLPYVIGAFLLGGTTNIAKILYDVAQF